MMMSFVKSCLIAGAAMTLPLAAFAQSSDTAYCKALSGKYREYAKANVVDAEAAAAMAQCDKSPAAGIPVLEKRLKDGKVPLPPR
jgi:hypothetical protein